MDVLLTLYLGFAVAASVYYSYQAIQKRSEIGRIEVEIVEAYKEMAGLEAKKETFQKDVDDIIKLYENQRKAEIDIEINKYISEKQEEKELLFQEIENSYSDFLISTQESADLIQEKINNLKQVEQSYKEKVLAATEAAKREQQIKDQDNYYKIQLSEDDLEEISAIKDILKHFRNKNLEPIQKIIWKVYYERPVNDLLNRLLKSSEKTGIYKITDLDTGMCYIGQSVDLPTRIKTHIKAGLGINSSNNRLYSAMKQKSPENFSYEIIELCKRAQLNEKEKYWIDFYESNKYGLNTLKGVNS